MKRRTLAISHTECWSLDEANSRCLNEYDIHSWSGICDTHASFDWSKSSYGLGDSNLSTFGIDWWMSKSWSIGLTWCWHVFVLPKNSMTHTITPRNSRWALFEKWFTW